MNNHREVLLTSFLFLMSWEFLAEYSLIILEFRGFSNEIYGYFIHFFLFSQLLSNSLDPFVSLF